MLRHELELMDVLKGKTGEVVNKYYQLVKERIKDEPEPPEDKFLNWKIIFATIKGAVDKKAKNLHKFNKQDCERSKALAGLLQKGIPISSFLEENCRRSINKKAKQLLVDLRETSDRDKQNKLDGFKGRLNEIINGFVEKPTNPIWVLNAAWVDRWGKLKEWDLMLSNLSDWQGELQKTDTILKKSIEAISIHEELQRNKDDPQ